MIIRLKNYKKAEFGHSKKLELQKPKYFIKIKYTKQNTTYYLGK